MNGVQVIQASLKMTQQMVTGLLKDFSDADLLVRPTPGANHVAWQLGHFINGEVAMVRGQIPQAAMPDLPANFAQQHGKETASQDPPAGFLTKAEYLDLFNRVRQASIAAFGTLQDSDLDRPVPGPMAAIAPTLGAFGLLISDHSLMHAGQFSVVRRKLGKPVLF